MSAYLRFFKRKRIFGGLATVNFSKHGVSFSIGGRGYHRTWSRHGVRDTIGAPGTGLFVTDHHPYSRFPHHTLAPRPGNTLLWWGFILLAIGAAGILAQH
jgi:hypothetical protein